MDKIYKIVYLTIGFIIFTFCCSEYKKYDVASWYGPQFHGRKTSCGEVFDMWKFTAAHKKLPLGTIIKVTNVDNGKCVTVKVTDRGPFVWGRGVDLSYAAAQKIGMSTKGVQKVKVEVLKYPK